VPGLGSADTALRSRGLDFRIVNADAVQLDVFRRLGPEERVRAAFEMSDETREIASEGVRSRHPEYDAERVRLAVLRLCLGEALFSRAYPGIDVNP